MPGAECVNAHAVRNSVAFVAMQFVGDTVWAVGGAGIWSSPDRGRHWYQRRAVGDLSAVDFVDSAHGWVVGGRQILVTTDAGTTWSALPEPHCLPIRMVHFVSVTNGFAVAGRQIRGRYDGDVLLESTDGGESWQALAGVPSGVETVCFQDESTGWIGTAHGIYASIDGGASWRRLVRAPGGLRRVQPFVDVQCAGAGIAWALTDGMGGASSQSPHIGWRLTTTGGKPLFAEQYFPHPTVMVKAESAGSYPGPFSAISPDEAAYVDFCPACGLGTAPWLVAHALGGLMRRGIVGDLSAPVAGTFASSTVGCVSGTHRTYKLGRVGATVDRIVCTYDGGAHWLTTWERPSPA